MIKTMTLCPGVTLRCCRDSRFKQNFMSFQFVQHADAKTASLDALLPSVLLRGCRKFPGMQAIANRGEELYGASIGTLVRAVGDYHTTGLSFSMMDERFALPGDKILEPMLALLEGLLFDPLLEDGHFCEAFVEQEKRNLLQFIESNLDNKQAYALYKLGRIMAKADARSVPRLGEPEIIREITAQSLYDHYRQILRHSRFELFYVGSAEAEEVAQRITPMLRHLQRDYIPLPPHRGFQNCEGEHVCEVMDVAQGKLCMGFVSTIDNRSEALPALVLLNMILGGGMTSKLFMNVREKLSLCYSVGSSLRGSKGTIYVYAGIDFDKEAQTRQEILRQVEACRKGEITREELEAARQYLLSALSTVYDSPRAIENNFAVDALSGALLKHEEYVQALHHVTLEQVIAAANTITLHSTVFLKGAAE